MATFVDWDDEYDQQQAQEARRGQARLGQSAAPALGDLDDDFPMGEAPEAGGGGPPPFTDEVPETPLEQMIRHWVNERHAPDILPAQEDLLSVLLDHLRSQTRNVQILREDPGTSESEHIRIMLVQTEIERVKFIIRSYIRTRLFKIEKYARYIISDADVQTRLTAAERDHASRHAKLTDQHLYLSVLQSLPEAQAHLDDTPVFFPSMVTQPDKTRPVFVHALLDCPPVRLPDGTALEMKKGHISLTLYSVVEQLVARGEVELV